MAGTGMPKFRAKTDTLTDTEKSSNITLSNIVDKHVTKGNRKQQLINIAKQIKGLQRQVDRLIQECEDIKI